MTAKLHDDIYAALPEDFIRRMQNWARSLDGGSVRTTIFRDRVDTFHWRPEVPLPTLLGEATDTHKAVQALPQRYQEVVTVFWSRPTQTLAWMATSTPRCRLWKLGPASFEEWLSIGHERLRAMMAQCGRASQNAAHQSETIK